MKLEREEKYTKIWKSVNNDGQSWKLLNDDPEGCMLINADLAAEHFPYTFFKVSMDCLRLLKSGDICQVTAILKKSNQGEKIWVKIQESSKGVFTGTVHSHPEIIKDLKHGDIIQFSFEAIIDANIEDPTPCIAKKYMNTCFVSGRVLREGEKVDRFYRKESMGTHKSGTVDSGWHFMAGTEDKDYVTDSKNLHCVSLGNVLRVDDRVINFLDEPVGSAFKWNPNTSSFEKVT